MTLSSTVSNLCSLPNNVGNNWPVVSSERIIEMGDDANCCGNLETLFFSMYCFIKASAYVTTSSRVMGLDMSTLPFASRLGGASLTQRVSLVETSAKNERSFQLSGTI
jgi:hypothetical protein